MSLKDSQNNLREIYTRTSFHFTVLQIVKKNSYITNKHHKQISQVSELSLGKLHTKNPIERLHAQPKFL